LPTAPAAAVYTTALCLPFLIKSIIPNTDIGLIIEHAVSSKLILGSSIQRHYPAVVTKYSDHVPGSLESAIQPTFFPITYHPKRPPPLFTTVPEHSKPGTVGKSFFSP